MTFALALLCASTFMGLAALHGYWALGGRWPGKDADSLALLVVDGLQGTRMPGSAACLAVAGALTMAALALLLCIGLLESPLPAAWPRALVLFSGAVLVVRGAAGFFYVRLRPAAAGTPFARLNMRLYSPLALGLGALTLAVAGVA